MRSVWRALLPGCRPSESASRSVPPDLHDRLREIRLHTRLPKRLQARFELAVRSFLTRHRITGIDLDLDDRIRVCVGASAVCLSLGWPEYTWPQLSEVLVYPRDFDRDYGFSQPELAGQAHGWGTVILSAPALIEGFVPGAEASHVGLHEFAHLLDSNRVTFSGIPAGVDEGRARTWVAIMEDEMARLRRGDSVLDDYGAHQPAEFFPVAVEAFFQAPLALRRRHDKLYDWLRRYFAQDPAQWMRRAAATRS